MSVLLFLENNFAHAMMNCLFRYPNWFFSSKTTTFIILFSEPFYNTTNALLLDIFVLQINSGVVSFTIRPWHLSYFETHKTAIKYSTWRVFQWAAEPMHIVYEWNEFEIMCIYIQKIRHSYHIHMKSFVAQKARVYLLESTSENGCLI